MNHFWTVFEREYFQIVKKRAFWLTTLLLPFGIALIFGIQIAAIFMGGKSECTVWVMGNQKELLQTHLVSGDGLAYRFTQANLDSVKTILAENKGDVAIQLPDSLLLNKKEISIPVYHAGGNVGESILRTLKDKLHDAVYDYKRDKLGLKQSQLDELVFQISPSTQRITENGSQQSSTSVAYMMGFLMNLLMYILVVMYGAMIMQSVIEEKNNRIVEIILSSISPFQLLMGKILAVALAGLTQFALWVILSGVVLTISGVVMGFSISPSDIALSQSAVNSMSNAEATEMAREMAIGLKNFNSTILLLFPIYFIGGFLLFGSIYAALGSAVDNIQDGQQFTMPLTFMSMLPMLFVPYILNNPNAPFAIACSIFPFFSPMVMMARMALTDVPLYQILISILVLIGSFVAGVWVSAKIYRTGVLMYGKKPSMKELWKWIRY